MAGAGEGTQPPLAHAARLTFKSAAALLQVSPGVDSSELVLSTIGGLVASWMKQDAVSAFPPTGGGPARRLSVGKHWAERAAGDQYQLWTAG